MNGTARTEALRRRLDSLRALSMQTNRMYGELESELIKDMRSFESMREGVDATADVLNILVGLGSIVKHGMHAMGLHGKALEEANKELGKEALKFSFEPARDATAKHWATTLGMNDGQLWAFGKITVQSWFQMQSPSFWAGVYTNLKAGKSWSQAVTEDPKDALEQALLHVRNQRKQVLSSLQTKIWETERDMAHN